MRIDSALSLMFLLVGMAAPLGISQDTAGPGSRNSHSVITAISVAEHTDSVDVEVTFTTPVQAKVRAFEHPDRLVFDFPGCELARAERLVVNRGSVLAVRASGFSLAPPIARVVIDLRSPQDHEETYVGNKLVIKLDSTGGARRLGQVSRAINPAANIQPLAPESNRGSDRAAPKSSDDAPPMPSAQPSSRGAHMATAYALLDKARGLTVSDLEPLEAEAQAGDLSLRQPWGWRTMPVHCSRWTMWKRLSCCGEPRIVALLQLRRLWGNLLSVGLWDAAGQSTSRFLVHEGGATRIKGGGQRPRADVLHGDGIQKDFAKAATGSRAAEAATQPPS